MVIMLGKTEDGEAIELAAANAGEVIRVIGRFAVVDADGREVLCNEIQVLDEADK